MDGYFVLCFFLFSTIVKRVKKILLDRSFPLPSPARTKEKNPQKRAENQAGLSLLLEAASGFYFQLMQDVCAAFKLDVPFRSVHYGTKPGHFETSKIHFPTSEGVSKVSKRANKRAQRRVRAKRAVRSKQTSERCERTSERTSEWPSTYVSILVSSRP